MFLEDLNLFRKVYAAVFVLRMDISKHKFTYATGILYVWRITIK